MKILHRYILTQFFRNLLLSILVFIILFTVFDFFDRIDNVLEEDASFGTVLKYFLYKIPLTINLMLPVAALVATLLTFGLLSKNSELIAMRSSGLTLLTLAKPVFILTFLLSIFSILFGETVVPHSTRRVREIYNIDIRKKHESGTYSQENFWWRDGEDFYSVGTFDSRSNVLFGLSKLQLNQDFSVRERVVADSAKYLNPNLGWQMEQVSEYEFHPDNLVASRKRATLPLPISYTPKDFYRAETDPHTMSHRELRSFVDEQKENGISVAGYLADLHAKLAFPFVIFIVSLVVLPFSLQPARTGSMAPSFIAGLIIGFSYYAVHSVSIAMGRAEIWPPILAAWMANALLGLVGIVLNLGAEAPS